MFKRWQDWMMALLGCWLILSPSILGATPSHAITGNAYGVGATLIAFNVISAARLVDSGQEIVNLLLGGWLVASPYVLGFHGSGCHEYNASAVGVAVIVLAIWQIYRPAETPSDSNDT